MRKVKSEIGREARRRVLSRKGASKSRRSAHHLLSLLPGCSAGCSAGFTTEGSRAPLYSSTSYLFKPRRYSFSSGVKDRCSVLCDGLPISIPCQEFFFSFKAPS